MFYYQRQQTEPVPLGYHNLEMTCRSLEPGEPYLFYILSKHRPEHPLPVFTFQEYVPPGKGYHELKVSYKKVFSIYVLALNPFINAKFYPIVWRNKRKTSNTLGFSQEPLTDDNAYGHLSDGSKGSCWQLWWPRLWSYRLNTRAFISVTECPFQRRKATVIMRALEAVWNLSPALVSSQLSWFLQLVLSIQPFIKIIQVLDFLFPSVSALWECITPAHTTRRLPKPASTLTISSDDLDDRDGPSESGWLLYFKGFMYLFISKEKVFWVDLKVRYPSCVSTIECIDNQLLKARMLSRAVLTHQLKKMKSKMAKCKQCDNYIVVSGIECEQVWRISEERIAEDPDQWWSSHSFL